MYRQKTRETIFGLKVSSVFILFMPAPRFHRPTGIHAVFTGAERAKQGARTGYQTGIAGIKQTNAAKLYFANISYLNKPF
jgi:hypothetical protein